MEISPGDRQYSELLAHSRSRDPRRVPRTAAGYQDTCSKLHPRQQTAEFREQPYSQPRSSKVWRERAKQGEDDPCDETLLLKGFRRGRGGETRHQIPVEV